MKISKNLLGASVAVLFLFVGAGITHYGALGPADSAMGTLGLLTLTVLGIFAAVLLVPVWGWLRSFWGACALSLMIATPILASSLLGSLPLIGPLWNRDTISILIVSLVTVVVCWCLVFLVIQLWLANIEWRAIKKNREYISSEKAKINKTERITLFKDLREHDGIEERQWVSRRLKILEENYATPERAEQLMMEYAELDAAKLQTLYGPFRALVWALPALGFMGTAATMANSIGSIGEALGAKTQTQEQFHLLGQVVPHLADAFGITLMALAGAVLCYFALAVVYQFEEKVLDAAREIILELIPMILDTRPVSDVTDPSDRLFAEFWSLEREIAGLKGTLNQYLEGRGNANTINFYLHTIANYLDLLSELAIDYGEADKQDYFRELKVKGVPKIPGVMGVLMDILKEIKRYNEFNKDSVQREDDVGTSPSNPDSESLRDQP